MECKAVPNNTCIARHNVLDQMEDVDAIETIQTEVSTAFGVAIEKRKQIEGHLQAAITANGKCLNKLRALAEKKKLSANKTGAFSTKKKLEELLVKAKEEVKKAEKVWTDINVSAITEVFLIVSTLLFNRKFSYCWHKFQDRQHLLRFSIQWDSHNFLFEIVVQSEGLERWQKSG